MPVVFFADLRYRDRLAVVERGSDRAAKQRFEALSMRQGGREPAGDVVCDMAAADRERVGENEIAGKEDPDRRRAAAHVDDGHPEIHLVRDKTGEPRGIGADDERLGLKMRASDRGGVVAHRGDRGGHDMHVDAEPLPGHAARIADAAALVNRKSDGDRMDDLAVVGAAHAIAALQYLAHVAVADLAVAEIDLRLDDARPGKPS